MLKRLAAVGLALLGLWVPALAEVYEGTTAALSSVAVISESSGALLSLDVQAGQRVEAGDTLATLRPERTFAAQDGTVSLLSAAEGDAVSGAVLEIAPLERYTLYCTVDKAYQTAENTLVHSGETLYVKCTSDGTHRAVGIVTGIEGDEYRVLTLGGELYVGETVYLYRDTDFTAAQRVGIGTVVVSDAQAYEAEGTLTRLRVSAGDTVERGQLLFETNGGTIAAPVGGILASLSCQPGDAVEKGQVVAGIVPEDAVCVEIKVDEAAVTRIRAGAPAWLIFPGGDAADAVPGTVVDILDTGEADAYTVRILPDTDGPLALGMSVEVRIASQDGE